MITEQDYKDLRERIGEHRHEECSPELRVTNEQRSQVELYEWMNAPPDRYFAYVRKNGYNGHTEITTWTGDRLGFASLGQPYYSNFGDRRRPISVTGLNGIDYHGTYYEGSGDYCRLTAYLHQNPEEITATRDRMEKFLAQ